MNSLPAIGLALALALPAAPAGAVTVSAPYLVKEISPAAPHRLSHMTAVGDTLFFFTPGQWPDPPVLWKTDGTAAGTVRVADAGVDARTLPYRDLGRVRNVIAFRDMLAFGTFPPSGLWTSDGTTAGTGLVVPLEFWETGVDPSSIAIHGNRLFVVGFGPDHTWGLWRSDGTPEGTTLVTTLELRYPNSAEITTFRGMLILLSGRGVWMSDGTAEGTRQIVITGAEASFLRARELRVVRDDLALFNSCGEHRRPCQLWRTDGSDEGTFAIATLNESYDDDDDPEEFQPTILSSVAGDGSFLVCTAKRGGVWSSDGTAEGTHRVALPGCDLDTVKQRVGGVWVFEAGGSLWRSDGTPEGTRSLDAFGGGRVQWVLGHTDEVVLLAVETEEGETELWRSDGTAAGTFAVSPMPTVGVFEYDGWYEIARPVAATVGDTVFFSGCTPDLGCDLWAITISSPSTTTTSTSTTTTTSAVMPDSTTSTTLACPSGGATPCDDADPCTVDVCEAGRCRHHLRPGLAGVRCRLRHRALSLACEDQIPHRLQRRLERAGRFVRRAADAGNQRKARRRIRQATRQLDAAGRLLARSVQHGMGSACADPLERALAAARAGMNEWLATDRG